MSNNPLCAALACYERLGWAVFPVVPRGKSPLTVHGLKDATTQAAQIREWWLRWPNANIGLWPGPSGLCILDADGPIGLEAARDRGLLDPPTLNCITGRPDGGRHLYFQRPSFHVGNRRLASKLDVRCDDGYVVLPPSVHPSGAVYRWVGRLADLRPLPAGVVNELERIQHNEPTAPPGAIPFGSAGDIDRRARAYIDRVGIRSEGDRNNTAFRVAAFLVRDLALDSASAWAYLLEWNAGNAPPLSGGELRGRLASAAKHGKRGRGSGLVRLHEPRQAPVRPWKTRKSA